MECHEEKSLYRLHKDEHFIISIIVAVLKLFLVCSTVQRIHMSKGDLCPVTTSEFSSPVNVNGQENITWSTNQTNAERILHAASMIEFVLILYTHV